MESDVCKVGHLLEGTAGHNDNLFEEKRIIRTKKKKKDDPPIVVIRAQEVKGHASCDW